MFGINTKKHNYSFKFTSRHTFSPQCDIKFLFRSAKQHQAMRVQLLIKLTSHIKRELQNNTHFAVLGVYADTIRYPLPNVQEISFEVILSSNRNTDSLSKTIYKSHISCGSLVANAVASYKHLDRIHFTQHQFNRILTIIN